MTLYQWQTGKIRQGKIDPFIHDAVRKLIESTPSPVELVIAGFTKSGSVLFYKTSNKNMIEPGIAPGVLAIGTGARLAMDHLNKRGQDKDFGLARTLLHLSEALDEARKEPTVGPPMAYTIVHKDGRISRVSPTMAIFHDWKKAYKRRPSTASLDGNIVAEAQLKLALQTHEVKRSQ